MFISSRIHLNYNIENLKSQYNNTKKYTANDKTVYEKTSIGFYFPKLSKELKCFFHTNYLITSLHFGLGC